MPSSPSGGRQSTCVTGDRLRRRARRRTAGAPTATTRGAPSEQRHRRCLRSTQATACRAAAALDRSTVAPAACSGSACRRGSCGSSWVAHSDTTTASSRPSAAAVGPGRRDGRGQLGGRVGVRAVAEHDVEQQHRAGRVGRLDGDPVEPGALVDHRVRPALGERVVAEVDHQVAGGRAGPVAERPLGPQRDVGPDLAERGRRDDHRLVAQRAAGEQPAQRPARAPDAGWLVPRPRLGPVDADGARPRGARPS